MVKRNSKTTLPLTELKATGASKGDRAFATETPVALTYNGVSHVVMMATPAELEEFAVGFSLSEEIITSPPDILSLEITEVEKGVIGKIEIPAGQFEALINRDRHLVGQSGCGICGVAEIEEAVRAYPKIKTKPKAGTDALFRALKDLPEHQPLNRDTGAVHAAAFCSWDGNIMAAFEDVGRHNAFDKLIGHMALQQLDFASGFALLTSRGSFELVQKALAMKIPMLVTISAATDLAVRLAKDHDLTLIALAREDAVLVLNDPNNIFT